MWKGTLLILIALLVQAVEGTPQGHSQGAGISRAVDVEAHQAAQNRLPVVTSARRLKKDDDEDDEEDKDDDDDGFINWDDEDNGGNQNGFFFNGSFDFRNLYHTEFVYGQIGYFKSGGF